MSAETISLANALKAEEEALRRRFVHHTRPKGPLSFEQAIALSQAMAPDEVFVDEYVQWTDAGFVKTTSLLDVFHGPAKDSA